MHTFLRSATLTTTHLWFTVRATTPLELDAFSGAALRGSLFHTIWFRFCTNRSASSCASCPLHSSCPVSALVAPLREESIWGRDIPRPYVLIPPLEGARLYQPGEQFSFGLTLIGNITQLLPYIMLALPQLEEEGLGRRLDTNAGRRGRFKIERVENLHPFTHQSQTIYEPGKGLVQVPPLRVEARECLYYAEQLDKETITLNFVTPLRLVDRERLVHYPTFRPLIQRLLERYLAFERYYGNAELSLDKTVMADLWRQAEAIRCIDDQMQWQDLRSYSQRQKRATQIGGLLGRVTFAGQLEPFLGLLRIGELIHVGKNAVKGNGNYTIEQARKPFP